MTPLAATYRAALVQSARDAVTRRARPQQLPGGAVVVHGHRVGTDQVERYAQLFGAVTPEDLPSVLVHVAAFPAAMELMAQPDFPLPLMGMVHLENRVQHHRPVPAETDLEIIASAARLAPHASGTTVDLVVTVHRSAADGAEPELLWEGVSTYLAKGVRLDGAERPERAEHPSFQAPEVTAQWRLSGSTGREYASVSGDYNPIHLHPVTAKALGMKGMIAHGMYLAGRMLAGREPAGAGHTWSIRFAAPVVLPATVQVNYAHPAPARTEVTGWNGRSGKPHFTGMIEVPEH